MDLTFLLPIWSAGNRPNKVLGFTHAHSFPEKLIIVLTDSLSHPLLWLQMHFQFVVLYYKDDDLSKAWMADSSFLQIHQYLYTWWLTEKNLNNRVTFTVNERDAYIFKHHWHTLGTVGKQISVPMPNSKTTSFCQPISGFFNILLYLSKGQNFSSRHCGGQGFQIEIVMSLWVCPYSCMTIFARDQNLESIHSTELRLGQFDKERKWQREEEQVEGGLLQHCFCKFSYY